MTLTLAITLLLPTVTFIQGQLCSWLKDSCWQQGLHLGRGAAFPGSFLQGEALPQKPPGNLTLRFSGWKGPGILIMGFGKSGHIHFLESFTGDAEEVEG